MGMEGSYVNHYTTKDSRNSHEHEDIKERRQDERGWEEGEHRKA